MSGAAPHHIEEMGRERGNRERDQLFLAIRREDVEGERWREEG